MAKDKSVNWLIYSIIILFLAVVVFGGYFGFIYFVTSIMGNLGVFSLLFIAIVAGVAVFFSPCSFPFIPVYLTKYYETKTASGFRKSHPLTLGVFAALGLLTFNILLGLAIAIIGVGFGKSLSIAGQDPNIIIRWVRGVVGVFLLYVGFSHITGRGLNLGFLAPRFAMKEKVNPIKTMYGYGFLYTLIGIGCAGPILAGLSVFAFSTGGFNSAFLAFVIYSLVMVLLMLFISILASLSRETLLEKLKANTGKIKKITGIIVIIVGIFLILSSIFVELFVDILFP